MCFPSPASRTQFLTSSRMRSSLAKRYMGSTFPCNTRSGPNTALASAMLVLQSRPMTSAVQPSFIPSSFPTPPLAWKMSGTSGCFAFTAAMTRSL